MTAKASKHSDRNDSPASSAKIRSIAGKTPSGVGTKAAKEQLWLAENAEAIRLENEYIEKNGLTLERYRLF